jgi:hypothetical protein
MMTVRVSRAAPSGRRHIKAVHTLYRCVSCGKASPGKKTCPVPACLDCALGSWVLAWLNPTEHGYRYYYTIAGRWRTKREADTVRKSINAGERCWHCIRKRKLSLGGLCRECKGAEMLPLNQGIGYR